MNNPTQVSTEFVRRHYAHGPTAYREDGSIAKMPTAADIDYAERQFDQWLAAHDAALVDALSTPPADDVREAVDHAVRAALSPLGIDYVPWWKVVHAVRDSLLAEPMLEVRPRGTVTDAANAWEYGVRHVAVDGWPTERVHISLEDARADLDTCGMNCHLIRRSGAQAAGEWHAIDYTGEARS